MRASTSWWPQASCASRASTTRSAQQGWVARADRRASAAARSQQLHLRLARAVRAARRRLSRGAAPAARRRDRARARRAGRAREVRSSRPNANADGVRRAAAFAAARTGSTPTSRRCGCAASSDGPASAVVQRSMHAAAGPGVDFARHHAGSRARAALIEQLWRDSGLDLYAALDPASARGRSGCSWRSPQAQQRYDADAQSASASSSPSWRRFRSSRRRSSRRSG